MMWKLFIFDYDGLLVNTEDIVFAAVRDVFNRYQKKLTWEYYCRHIGRPKIEALRDFHTDHKLPIPFDIFVRERDAAVERYKSEQLSLMKGARRMLDFLKGKKADMVVASSGTRTHVESGLRYFEIRDYFKDVVTIEDVKHGKPHPDLLLRALEHTGHLASDAIIFEDSPLGIEAARRAKVFSVAIPTRGVPRESFVKADHVFEDLGKVHTWLASLHDTPEATH